MHFAAIEHELDGAEQKELVRDTIERMPEHYDRNLKGIARAIAERYFIRPEDLATYLQELVSEGKVTVSIETVKIEKLETNFWSVR